MALVEDDCCFLGVHIRLSIRCKIWFTLGRQVIHGSLLDCLQIIFL